MNNAPISSDHRPAAFTIAFAGVAAALLSCGGGSSNSAFDINFVPKVVVKENNNRDFSACAQFTAPRFEQWHLDAVNALSAQCGAVRCSGRNMNIRVVDAPIEVGHCDLIANTGGNHFDFLRLQAQPQSPLFDSDSHGTSVAGLIAAIDNDMGVRGVAPDATLESYNLLADNVTANAIRSLSGSLTSIAVVNNSWGPADDGSLKFVPSVSIHQAIDAGISSGRDGRGTIFVWSGGNGGTHEDRSSYDGYASYRNVIAVGALLRNGTRAPYSEPGANLWISAPGGERVRVSSLLSQCTDAIVTADLSNGGINSGQPGELLDSRFTRCFNGTSASAPIVSGVVALMLQANPALGWRDVREILARTAIRTDPSDADWALNMANLPFNHSYGFGRVDAAAATERASTWTNISAPLRRETYHSTTASIGIPDNNSTGIASTITIPSSSAISQIEQLEIRLTGLSHPFWGDLQIDLVHSLEGRQTTSALSRQHTQAGAPLIRTRIDGQFIQNFTFTANAHFLEPARGSWTAKISDRRLSNAGSFRGWQITVYGR